MFYTNAFIEWGEWRYIYDTKNLKYHFDCGVSDYGWEFHFWCNDVRGRLGGSGCLVFSSSVWHDSSKI